MGFKEFTQIKSSFLKGSYKNIFLSNFLPDILLDFK